jgi:N-acetylmuramoyl-L-alanine amidase
MGLQALVTNCTAATRKVYAPILVAAAIGMPTTLPTTLPPLSSPAAVATMPVTQAEELLEQFGNYNYRAKKQTEDRAETKFVVIHTVEQNGCDINRNWLRGADSLVKRVKRVKGKRTVIVDTVWSEPRANILICEDSVYFLTDINRRVNHAGLSGFDGELLLNHSAAAIEIQGTYRKPLAEQLYRFGLAATTVLRHTYNLTDSAFLSHAQASFGIFKGDTIRARKHDATNLDWKQLGIIHRTDDPDVASGRFKEEPALAKLHRLEQMDTLTAQERVAVAFPRYGPVRDYYYGVTSQTNSPWSIAGEATKARSTLYFLPNKTHSRLRGSEIEQCTNTPKCKLTWYTLPVGTLVFPSVPESKVLGVTKELKSNYALYEKQHK